MPSHPFYLTTPIYYASEAPHIGHAYTTIVGDCIARYQRLIHSNPDDVFYLTGTDEHGEKIERAAAAKQLSPQMFVDGIAQQYKSLWTQLHIQYDDFIRTTEPRHQKIVQELWQKLVDQGDIYKDQYEGLYCIPCESFYLEKDLLPGLICKDHKRKVETVKEESYFFRLSRYEKPLLAHYDAHPNFVQPDIRFHEVRNFVEGGLRDLAVSRSSFRWGIPVPGDEKHVIYVWIDALTNYYSALQSSAQRQAFWGTKEHPLAIHLIGKEISRFHAVYWPAMLMAAGLPLPKTIFAHGWWTVDGEKMSKTLGNVVNPSVLAEDLGADALRYFLLREIPLGQDGDFSYDALLNRYNSELANDLGNLLNRTLHMVERFSNGQAKRGYEDFESQANPLRERAIDAKKQVEGAMATLQPGTALQAIFGLVRDCNAYLEQEAPFKVAKSNLRQAQFVLYNVLESLRWLGLMLSSFMPERSAELLRQLSVSSVTWPQEFGALPEGHTLSKGAPLFPRLDDENQTKLLQKWRAARQAAKPTSPETIPTPLEAPATNTKAPISFDTWTQVDLRIAVITAAEKVPKKDRLLKLSLSLGDEQRTVVSGIAEAYSPEQLIGKHVVFLANLQPAKIGGILSQGMILAVGEGTSLSLLGAEKMTSPGAVVK